MDKQTFREKVRKFLNSDAITVKIFDIFINALIVASIVQLLGEYQILNTGLDEAENYILDIAIASIFAFEYIIRLYAAPKRLKFVVNIFSIIDLLAIVPSFLGVGQAKGLRSLRALRLFRLLRLLRMIRLIKSLDISDQYKKETEAAEEVAYYNLFFDFYNKLSKNYSGNEVGHEVEPIEKETENMLVSINDKINENSGRGSADEKQIFYINFYELLKQARASLKLLGKDRRGLDMMKIKYLVKELGVLLQSEHTIGAVKQLNDDKLNRDVQFLKLIRISIRDILVTFSIAVGLNVIISLTPFRSSLEPLLAHLSFVEGAMAALIVFITSFNMSYTNSKRGNTDLSIIDLTNLMIVYAENIKTIVMGIENNKSERFAVLNKVDHYFGCVGLDIIDGVRQGNIYHLRFDTASMQSFDRIKDLISPYLSKTDDITRNRMEEIHGNLISVLNKFQTLSTIRTAIIFNALNHWVIRITYFLLAVLSPLSALPRLFLVNLMQRAFYKTANETDNAIFNISLSKLPIEDRILRRLCRASSILQTS